MKRLLLLSFLLLFTLGCASKGVSIPSERQGWHVSEIAGYRYTLKDQKIIETFYFSEQGIVAAIIGEKDGPVAGPLFGWEIDKGLLLIKDEGKIVFTFAKIKASEAHVVVESEGQKQTFYKAKE